MVLSESDKVAHLLRRFGLGASEAEVEYYGKDGLNGAINSLLNYEKVDEGFEYDPVSWFTEATSGRAAGAQKLKDSGIQALKAPQLQAWWYARLIKTRRPLQEKMTLFWHDHFATSAEKVTSAALMYQQNEILRKNATGKFKTILTQVSKDPAMLFWLDNQFNVKSHPNENFAREVMELFTLGIGNYTEQDIQEAARAFSGWTLAASGRRGTVNKNGVLNAKVTFSEGNKEHDEGVKTIFGSKGNFNGDDVIGILCSQPKAAWYLTWKIWEWFAYREPESEIIDRLAAKFFASGFSVKSLIRSVMESPEFYSEKAVRKVYKNPIDFTIASVRALGIGSMANPQVLAAAGITRNSCKSMGMDLLFPPDVSGWDGGPNWISSATMVERIKWASFLFGESDTSAKKLGSFRMRVNTATLFGKDPTPEGVVKTLLSVFDVALSPAKMTTLVAAAQRASGGRITQQNANEVATTTCKLIFGSPEFQFC